jgi:hypothetical protein
MAKGYGCWPGVAAIAADADVCCVPCARGVYGEAVIDAVVNGAPGYERFTDHEGNPFGVVLGLSEDLHGMYCWVCGVRLCDEDCSCYDLGREGVM